MDTEVTKTELTEQQRKAVAVLARCGYRKGGTKCNGATLAAEKAGVARSTIYLWLESDYFVDAIEALKETFVCAFWNNLLKASAKESVAASIYCLKVLNRAVFDDDLNKQLDVIKAKLAQLEEMLDKYPVPALDIVTPQNIPTLPPELEKFIH